MDIHEHDDDKWTYNGYTMNIYSFHLVHEAKHVELLPKKAGLTKKGTDTLEGLEYVLALVDS